MNYVRPASISSLIGKKFHFIVIDFVLKFILEA